ncbi:MAG TPA: HdeD family acid-resistance protein [Mycobacterium sp.]|nr:HdeD family acid-resistance protein [Mycobacterium sp.]
MQTTAGPKLLPHLWKSTLASGILALVLGVLVLYRPGESILAAAILFGIYLVIIGIAQVFFAFSLPVMSAGGRVLLFISGAAALILAVLCFRHLHSDEEATAVLLLAIWIGIGFIFRGVATTVAGISDPNLPGRGWEIFMGVLTLLAGIVVLASPLASLVVLALVVGIWLIVIGAAEIITAFSIRRTAKTVERVLSDG